LVSSCQFIENLVNRFKILALWSITCNCKC